MGILIDKPQTSEDAQTATLDELLSKLSASKSGLTSSEAESRSKQYGPNEIPEKVSAFRKFVVYFWRPIRGG